MERPHHLLMYFLFFEVMLHIGVRSGERRGNPFIVCNRLKVASLLFPSVYVPSCRVVCVCGVCVCVCVWSMFRGTSSVWCLLAVSSLFVTCSIPPFLPFLSFLFLFFPLFSLPYPSFFCFLISSYLLLSRSFPPLSHTALHSLSFSFIPLIPPFLAISKAFYKSNSLSPPLITPPPNILNILNNLE